MMQIGDMDRLWCETIGNPASPFNIFSYNAVGDEMSGLMNYFMASGRNDPFFARCHKLFLALWAADGGKTSTEGMHSSPLLKAVPLVGGSWTFEENGPKVGAEEVSRLMTDYLTQGQVIRMVSGLVDEEDAWDGPKYISKHVYGIQFTVGSQLINELTQWDGQKAFDLMSLPLPKAGQTESAEQKQAREIVEECLQKSFAIKLAQGIILRVCKSTLGSLWKKHEGSDNVLGTYAHWLRHATVYWNQDEIPRHMNLKMMEPYKRGPLLQEI